ncbi:MAG TPA: hypothetical protein VGR62_06045 [Candidatus Binatia bacterium]|nr:hypothetical protein [Candidatus Binatia bacterium]
MMVAATLSACSVSIGELNLRPEQHYEEKVSIKGRIARREAVGSETLLEIADERECRILVRVNGPVTEELDTWVKVSGVLVPEMRVGSQVLYDVVAADDVSSTGAPWFPNLL